MGDPIVFEASFDADEYEFEAAFESDSDFSAEFGNVIEVPVADYYDGDYEVIPRLYDQDLSTQGLAMREDMTVKEIPITYTSNIFDGKTVVIG